MTDLRQIDHPDEASNEQLLDVVDLLEAHVDNPAAAALHGLVLGWYMDRINSAAIAYNPRLRVMAEDLQPQTTQAA